MGCLIIFLSILLFFVFPPLGIFTFVVGIVVLICRNNQSVASTAAETRELKRIALRSAPPEVQAAEAERERKEENQRRVSKLIAAGGIVVGLVILYASSHSSSNSSYTAMTTPSSTPYTTPTPYAEATPTPAMDSDGWVKKDEEKVSPRVERALPVSPAKTHRKHHTSDNR